MATHLALEEQEQLDQLKAFWKRYGNLLTWLVTLVALGFVAWNGWNWWQRDQAGNRSTSLLSPFCFNFYCELGFLSQLS